MDDVSDGLDVAAFLTPPRLKAANGDGVAGSLA